MHIAVIGAGAAGCFAAIGIKRRLPEADVTIYEGGKRQLAKVSVTGGGRCNLTNSFNQVKSLAHIYPRGERLMKRLLKGFSHTDAYEWFENEGVRLTTQEDECVFPVSQDAMEIVNTLTQIINRLGIRLLTGHRVELISHDKENGKYSLRFGGNRSSATADCVVVAIGGTPAASQLNMFSPLGIITENPVPSLFSMCLPGDGITKLMGTVVEEATTSIPGTKFKADGPLLITHWGMSGPAILKLSSHAARFLHEHEYKTDICINWCGGRKAEEVTEELSAISASNTKKQLASAYPPHLNARLWQHLIERSQVNPQLRWGELQRKGLNKLINTLTADIRRVDGKCRFKEEFVTCGGVSLKNVNHSTLESKDHDGLYFAGEVLDVDAVTGGFNLQAAWTMGHTVAVAIEKKYKN